VALQLLYEAAGDGSWRMVVADAGHCDFLSVGQGLQAACGAFCFPGSALNPDVVGLTIAPLTAWLDTQVRGSQRGNDESLLDEFYDWTETQQRDGKVQFNIKEEEGWPTMAR